MQVLVERLGEFATTHHLPDPSALQRIFSLLVAANHSCSSLSGPGSPFPTNPTIPLPSTTEWLLLAARERAIASLPSVLGDTVDVLIARLDSVSTTNLGDAVASPIVDYGLGSLLAAITGQPHDSPAFVAGQAMGKLTRLALEVALATRPSSSFLTPVLLHSITALDHESESRLGLAVAMACKPVPDKLPLLSFLGQGIVRTRINDACEAWSEVSTRVFDDAYPDNLQLFFRATSDVIKQKINSLQLFGFAKAPSLEVELDRTIEMAVEALLDDPELRESWEFQRWGGPFPRTCIGRFFPVGLCTLALATASIDPAARTEQLLSLRSLDGIRYFEGFVGIAPDSDDFGLALQLIARIPQRDAYMAAFAWPVEVVVRNTSPEGEIPVWIEHHLREPLDHDAPKWRGSRCLAVAANAVIGLLEARASVPAEYIDRVIAWITRTWRSDGMRAVFFYGLPYARYVLVRLAEVAKGRTNDPSIYEELRDVAASIEDAIVASVGHDGGFGGIIDTACHLAALACGRRVPFDPWPIIAFLASRQEHDGLWPAAPLFPTPGKDYASGAHGARSITTAMCLYALARSRSRLLT